MKITFVRHAEVIEEYKGKYNGHIDIPLSEYGKQQAKELAYSLKDEVFDKVYCSDLIRARETLEAFDLDVETIFTEDLREKSWGVHEGKSFEEIEASGIKYENFEQWLEALDGENIEVYRKNLSHYFYNTLLKDTSKNILVFTHSGFIKTLYSVVQKCSIEKAFSIELPYASSLTLDIGSMQFS